MSERCVDPAGVKLSLVGANSLKSLASITEEESDETRSAEAIDEASIESAGPSDGTLQSQHGAEENRWKLAFRQLVFMKRMNMQFNDRAKNEIELRQQNITVSGQGQSFLIQEQHTRVADAIVVTVIPYFNALTPDEITKLVAASQREMLRPGESKSLSCPNPVKHGEFYIIISGNLALAKSVVENAKAVKEAELLPSMKLGIGDYFAVHTVSEMKVIAMELVEYLVIPMNVITELNPSSSYQIQAETNDMTCEASETESYKQWALQFSLASTKCEFPSPEPGGLARCSVKTFCNDHFPHMSPENELDHTLEYVRTALTSIFSARRIRVYGVDEASDRLLIKFSDERLPKAHVGILNTIARHILEKREPVFAAKGSDVCKDRNDVLASTLYREDDMVLAAPFFEYFPLGVHKAPLEPAKIVGILEVIIGSRSSESDSNTSPDASPPVATENDTCILDLTAQELGRYLYFHYNEFFNVPSVAEKKVSENGEPSGHSDEEEDEPVTEVFPAPDVTAADDARTLVVSFDNLEFEGVNDVISYADVCIQLGRMPLATRTISFSCPKSPRKEKSGSQSPRKCSLNNSSTAEMGISLANIPHGSHLRIIFRGRNNEAIGWTGLHLFDFGHALRTGHSVVDIRAMVAEVITPLDVENCLKRDRPNKKNILGKLELTLECSGSSPQVFAFSSITKKKSITFRASIFYNSNLLIDPKQMESQSIAESMPSLPTKLQKLLLQVKKDPLVMLSPDDRKFIWESRMSLIEEPELLPTFLLSVDWSRREQVMEAYRLLIFWQPPTYLQALQLLSPAFPDPKVRAYAVRCMHVLPDHRLRLYLLQLVQVLKNERYHDSALARFLLMRGLMNPSQIGYLLYWYLKAESHIDQTSERFELIMSQYLQLCGSYKLELRQSVYVMKKLEKIAAAVKLEATKPARKEKLHEELRHAVLPETFQIPLHPRTYYNAVIVEKCRVMESKKRPLFLQLENAKVQHGCPYVIFKSGDDLRQDQLVIQILRVMDDLWREAELDLCLTPYSCISTGDEIGMIEVVPDSETLASIIYGRHDKSFTKLSRKLKSAKDALVRGGVLSDWLFDRSNGSDTPPPPPGDKPRNTAPLTPPTSPASPTGEDLKDQAIGSLGQEPRDLPEPMSSLSPSVSSCFPLSPGKIIRSMSKKSIAPPPRDEEITQNFIRSSAGYCVATYVLGIGDRHNDNIMLQRSGKFFHIDFGHFLGNFKSKLGVKRERAPFVFTPSMLDAIGGKKSGNYEMFKKLACDAFRVLRSHSNLLITLLVLALTCGIPELSCADDIKWVHKTLMIELSDEEAEKRFRKLIKVALNTKTTQINDAVHLMAH